MSAISEERFRLAILGNGPSLADIDLKEVRRIDSFGFNAAYRYWDRIGWYPTYYACLDLVVGMSHKTEIERLVRRSEVYGIKKFFVRSNLFGFLRENVSIRGVYDFDAIAEKRKNVMLHPITTGSHSAILGMLMGYKQIGLFGVDCNYRDLSEASRVKGNILRLSQEAKTNPNYFFDDYQRPGDLFNVPNPQPNLHLKSWDVVSELADRNNIDVFNCCPSSPFDKFPRLEPEQFLAQ